MNLRAALRLASLGVLLAAGLAAGADVEKEEPLTYVHSKEKPHKAWKKLWPNGQKFKFVVTETCRDQFDYALSGATFAADVKGAGAATADQDQVEIPGVYDSQYGIYLLQIKRKHGQNACPNLPDATLVIRVDADEWEVGQDATLTYTAGTSAQYTVDANNVVVRDSAREELGRFNFATLTHLYPPTSTFLGGKVGPALGFGIGAENELEYYIGGAVGFGERSRRVLNLAVGGVYARVNVLPAGFLEGSKTTADPKLLEKLPTKHAWRFFFGLTATFFKSNSSKPVAP